MPTSFISPAIPRTALVTGAGQRLGRAMALDLALSGFAVAVHCRASLAEAEATAQAVRAHGVAAVVLEADLAQEADTSSLLERATAALGPVGVLINNASVFERDEWHNATRESWDAHLEPNLRAPFLLSQCFARLLPPGAEGVIVNLLDQRVWSLTPHFASYTVSKAALWTLTRTLALALAPRIRVCGIGPGPALPSARQDAASFARQCRSTPLGRGTSPDEVARALRAILELPSMTGQMIALDGGQHLQWSPSHGVMPDE
jgi:NAD(P)-dependent dehydrogenase (short-subunit alcohol dehydrogenase family)